MINKLKLIAFAVFALIVSFATLAQNGETSCGNALD
jgi:hypothetical protein